MQDELDAKLMQRFATARVPLPEEPFLASLSARLQSRRPLAAALPSILGTIVAGLAAGILVPLRLKLTRYALLGAAAVTLLSVFA